MDEENRIGQLKIYHNNPSVKTLEDFAAYNKIYLGGEKPKNSSKEPLTIEKLFELNRSNIFNQLTVTEKIEYIKEKGFKSKTETDEKTGEPCQLKVEELTPDMLEKDITLPCPCYLFIEEIYVPYNLGIKHTNFQEQETSVLAFQDKNISDELKDQNTTQFETAKRMLVGCRVFGFFKTLYYKGGKGGGNPNDIYDRANMLSDITPYIISLSTNVDAAGGSFSITLPHLPLYTYVDETIYENKDNGEKVARGSSGYSHVVVEPPTQSDLLTLAEQDPDEIIKKVLSNEQFKVFNLWDEDNAEVNGYYAKSSSDTRDYFNWLIQQNDIILLSFDEMRDVKSEKDIAGKSFDMIGLVDDVSIVRDPSGNMTVGVRGRDLMKLLTEDSSLFFPQSVANGDGNVFDNTEVSNSEKGDANVVKSEDGRILINRLRMPVTGSIPLFTFESANGMTIDFVIKAVVSHLANMSIAPDEVFALWPENRRTKFNDLSPVPKDKPENKK